MSELDRRLLLAGAGLAGVAALGRLAKAGPLDPPPGPVAPTGNTLTEVYDKIARTDAGLAEARIPVQSITPDANGTYVISQTGSYYLTDFIFGGGSPAIRVTASEAELDLRGFRVQSNASAAIEVQSNNVRIRNGVIYTGSPTASGIRAGNGGVVSGLVLEGLVFRTSALGAGGSLPANCIRSVVRQCTFMGIGGDSRKISLGDYSLVSDCYVETGGEAIVVGRYSQVVDCVVNHAGSAGGSGISVGDHSAIHRCDVACVQTADHAVIAGAACLISQCTVLNATTIFGSSSCISVGEFSRVLECVVQGARRGIILGAGSECIGTSLRGAREGIVASSRCVVDRCHLDSLTSTGAAPIGLSLGTDCVARGNTIVSVVAGTGIAVNGTAGRIEDNTVKNCATGIQTVGTGSFVMRNACTGNTTDYSLAAGTKAGPIVSSPVDPNGSHPWANFAT
jgi:hypothetical protein